MEVVEPFLRHKHLNLNLRVLNDLYYSCGYRYYKAITECSFDLTLTLAFNSGDVVHHRNNEKKILVKKRCDPP